jgi:hypothetical protein
MLHLLLPLSVRSGGAFFSLSTLGTITDIFPKDAEYFLAPDECEGR